ncbi:hypothetical protein V6N13_148386 [Hibiscus sabdariffa]
MGLPLQYEEAYTIRSMWVHCLVEKSLNGWDDEGGNPRVAGIIFGDEEEPKNFIVRHTEYHVRTWKYQDEDAPPGGSSGDVAPPFLVIVGSGLLFFHLFLSR